MARERYLIGVDPEELKPSAPPPPEKPAGFLENLWYHYKWHIITIGFVLLLVGIGVYQLVSRDDPDYTMVIVTKTPLPRSSVEQLELEFNTVGRDLDGDGKVEVLIENLALGIDYSNQLIANENTLKAHFAAGDVLLYATEPEYYHNRFLAQAGDYDFFATLSNGQDYFEWTPDVKGGGETLYLGVRNATGMAEGNEEFDHCVELVEKFARQAKE